MTREPRKLTLTRVFDAPPSFVFRAWTEPKHMAQWWGPHGFTNPVCEMDVRWTQSLERLSALLAKA